MRLCPCALLPVACLAMVHDARAESPGEPSEVRILSADASHIEVRERTKDVAMVPVRTRYGTTMQRGYVYAPLCTTPCTAHLRDGEHVLAASNTSDGALIEAPGPVPVYGKATVTATYDDRSGWRAAGWVTFAASLGAGLVLTLSSIHGNTSCSTADAEGRCPASVDWGLMSAGLGVMGGGLIAATIMTLQQDSVSFSITPLTLGAWWQREGGLAMGLPNGIGLTARF